MTVTVTTPAGPIRGPAGQLTGPPPEIIPQGPPGAGGGGGAVDSVNGQTGVVVLDATDVGADATGTASAALAAHVAAPDPHPLYALESSLATVATTGAYADLTGKPTLGTAAPLNVAAAGDAASGEVVKGNDTRLTDARTPTNLTGPVTSVGNATAIANGAISNAMLANAAVANLSGTNTGDETGARVATLLHAASNKTSLVDADEVNGTDSAASFGLIRTTWTNVKAFLKTYFDTLYQAVLVSGTNIKTINSSSILGSGNLTVSATPGGSDTYLQGNFAGALGGSPNATINTSTGAVTFAETFSQTLGTITTNKAITTQTVTLNSGGTTFKLRTLAITNTASATASLVDEVTVGGTAIYSLRKDGYIETTKNGTVAYGIFVGGNRIGIGRNSSIAGLNLHGNTDASDGQASANLSDTALTLQSGVVIKWAASANVNVAADVGLSRNAAGVIEFNNGTAGTFRDAKMRSLLLAGSTSGTATLNASAVAGASTFTLPETGGILLTRNPSIQTVTSAATFTPNVDTESAGVITAQAVGLTIANFTGTPGNMQLYRLRVLDNGGAQTVAFGTAYQAGIVALPTTTVAGKELYMAFQYNTATAKFDLMAVGSKL